MDEAEADLLPEQKAARARALVRAGKNVAMVGDGINHAPVLSEASVGAAVGSGTDVARESADVVLLGNDLSRLVETVRVARRCRGIIWFNFAGMLLVDGVGVSLAAFGLLNPLLAAFIHVSSALAFILNSAWLLPAASGPRRGKMPRRHRPRPSRRRQRDGAANGKRASAAAGAVRGGLKPLPRRNGSRRLPAFPRFGGQCTTTVKSGDGRADKTLRPWAVIILRGRNHDNAACPEMGAVGLVRRARRAQESYR